MPVDIVSYLSNMIKIRLTNSFGKPIAFDAGAIKASLKRGIPEHNNEAFIWAERPMVLLEKCRRTKRGPYHYNIIEMDEDRHGKLVNILEAKFSEEDLDIVVKSFMLLCENPQKKLKNKLLKKLGTHAIIIHKTA